MAKTLNDEFELELSDQSQQTTSKRKHNSNLITDINDTVREMDNSTHDYSSNKSHHKSNHNNQSMGIEQNIPKSNNSKNDNDRPDDAKPRRRQRVVSNTPAIVGFFTDRRLHIFFALLCMIVGIIMVVILVSHIRDGGNDQSRAANLSIEQIATATPSVDNAGGSFGAKLAQVLFTEALGLGSLIIALYLITIGINIIRCKKLNFWSKTFKATILTVALSIVPGLICFTLGTEINWGGTHGHYVNENLMHIGGPMIAIAVSIILIAAIICIYLNDLVRIYKLWKEKQKTISTTIPTFSKKRNEASSLYDKPIVEPINSDNESEQDTDVQQTTYQAETKEDSTNKKVTPTNSESGFTIDDKSDDQCFEIETPQADIDDDGKAIAQSEPFDHRAELSRYRFPSLDLLNEVSVHTTVDMDEQQDNKDRIIKALADHKVYVSSIKATVGPTVTLFEVVPTEGTRIAQIKRLEDDIAMTLKARGIRIIAPMPGKGTVGIEVPNNDPQTVSMRSVLASTKFRECKKALPVALGATVSNDIFVADLASMPHVLVAGATGQGKSVGLNCIIASLLYKKHPTELKFVLIDPKEVEFSLYSKLANHYLAAIPGMDEESGIITKNENVLLALNSLCVLMDQRYTLLRKAGVRNIVEYNAKFSDHRLNPEKGHDFMPYIVVIIDEFADLIMTAGKEIELPVTRITQKARAVGIHMVIATQRPSTNVLTGLIKANCPTRIAFRVMQMVDSRTILDRPGANQLIGRGDMLYSSGGEVERMQCAFIDTNDVENLCTFVGEQIGFEKPYYLPEPKITDNNEFIGTSHATASGAERDPLFDEAAHFIITQSTASVSSLQRRYQIGYNRAGKIMDQMEACGIVGPAVGSKPRQILVDGPTLDLILENKSY